MTPLTPRAAVERCIELVKDVPFHISTSPYSHALKALESFRDSLPADLPSPADPVSAHPVGPERGASGHSLPADAPEGEPTDAPLCGKPLYGLQCSRERGHGGGHHYDTVAPPADEGLHLPTLDRCIAIAQRYRHDVVIELLDALRAEATGEKP